MKSQINSFEDACKALNIQPLLPDISMLPEAQGKCIIAQIKVDAITEARNNEWMAEAWVPDYNDLQEGKYWPVFEFSPGSGWSYYDCDGWSSGSHVGARPFRTWYLAEQTANDFKELYNDILNWYNGISK